MLQVSHARRVYGVNGEVPDSYVKCYLRDGDKWLHKRKTRVIRRTTEPHFKQTLKYQVSGVSHHLLVVFNLLIVKFTISLLLHYELIFE